MSLVDVQRAHSLPVYYEDQFLTCREPELPLAPGAVELIIKNENDTPEITSHKIYEVYQKLTAHWTNQSQFLAAGSYYLERKDAASGTTLRQIIPYSHGGLQSICRQIQVTWNLMCPKLAWTSHQVLGTADALIAALQASPPYTPQTTEPEVEGKDAFCNQKRITAQRVYEGKNINLLCNFKPLATRDLLITSRTHAATFDKDTFIEAMSLGRRITEQHANQGFPIAYLLMADHKFAGQTVPHAHIHVTSARTVTEELLAIARVVRKILIDSWFDLLPFSPFRLSDKQLAVKIQEEKNALKSIFEKSI